MPIAVLVLALAAYAYALVNEPGFRRWGLLLGAGVGLGLAVYFWQNAPERALGSVRIGPEELTLDELALDTTQRGATLTGRVQNASELYRLREMTVDIRLFDCPDAETATEDCPVIGESSAIARPDTPPGQLRGFTAHFVFSNLPPLTGELRWDWRVSETRATD